MESTNTALQKQVDQIKRDDLGGLGGMFMVLVQLSTRIEGTQLGEIGLERVVVADEEQRVASDLQDSLGDFEVIELFFAGCVGWQWNKQIVLDQLDFDGGKELETASVVFGVVECVQFCG